MSVEEQTLENTRNIASLTTVVTKLSAMFEYSEKSRGEERADTKAAVVELRNLNEKISSLAVVQKEVSALSSDVRAASHDLRNLQSTMGALTTLKEKIEGVDKRTVDHEARINSLEAWRDKADGASGAVKVIVHVIWAFVSVGGLSFMAWLFSNYERVQQGVTPLGGG